MSKFSLDNKAKKVAIVLNPEKGNKTFYVETMDALDMWLESSAERYAYILHDLDVKEDADGKIVPKTPHIHLYAELKVCQRMSTTLNKIADALNLDEQCISIQKATDPDAVIQYLVHKNQPEKHQYELGAIRTNLDEGELKAVMESDTATFSLTWLVSVCATSANLIQVIEKVGIPKYQSNRNLILDVWHEVKKGARR